MLGNVVVGDGASGDQPDLAFPRQPFDAGALGAVADEQQRRALEALQRVHGLLERVELAEAPDPADDELPVETQTAARRVTIRTRAEQLRIDCRSA